MDTKTKTKNPQVRSALGRIENINQIIDLETVSDIYFAFDHFYPEGTIYSADNAYSTKNFFWNNQAEFKEYVKEKTGITIRDANDRKSIKEAQKKFFDIAEGKIPPEMKGAEKPPVEGTMPTQEILEKAKGEEVSTTEAKRKEAIARSNEAVRRAIDKKIINKEEADKLRQTKVSVKPVELIPEKELDPKSKQQLFNLAQAIKTDPGTVQKTLEERLKVSIAQSAPEVREQIPETLIPQYVADFTNRVTPLGIYSKIEDMPNAFPAKHPASEIAALANPQNINLQKFIPNEGARNLLAQEAASLSLGIEYQNQVFRSMSATWMEPAVLDVVYPENIVKYDVVQPTYLPGVPGEEPRQKTDEESVEISVGDVIDQGDQIEQIYNRIHSATNKVTETETIATEFNTAYTTFPTYTPVSVATPEGVVVAEQTSKLLTVVPTSFGAVAGFRQGAFATKWASETPLLGAGGAQIVTPLLGAGAAEMVGVSSGISANLVFNANIGKFTFSVITAQKGSAQVLIVGAKLGEKSAGLFLGAAGKQVVLKGVGAAGKIAVSKVVGSKVAGLIGKGIAALSGATGPVGLAIGAAVGYAFSKVVEVATPLIKKAGKGIAIGFGILGGALLGAGTGMGFILGGALGGFGTAGLLAFAGGGLPALASSAGGLFSTIGGAFSFATKAALIGIGTPLAIILIGIPLTIAIILFIINSGAYVVPPGSIERGIGGATPADCTGDPPSVPSSGEVKLSADGNYAYPVGEFPNPPYSAFPKACWHWDGNKAADLFNSPHPRSPLLAYENGKIVNITLNDSAGGKYIILYGETSKRYYYYAHLCHVFVSNNQQVRVGDVIGTMDETGTGRVEHLHFAINSPALGDFFAGGDGDICPYSDFEEKFNFGICSRTRSCVSP